jgi:TonB-dependent receptor
MCAAAVSALLTGPAIAQDAPAANNPVNEAPAGEPAGAEAVDEVVVTGMRATQRTSNAVKRDATVIVDALVNDEIGATPDNSVGETLERITGVTSDRFKGSASEISVRGLGPFLGFSTLNGREVSSGSGDRAVSFQQFPSELVNGVLVYKSQQADFVEGGVSGVIELRTLKPLEYGKRRIQVEGRANYLPYNARVRGNDEVGARFAASFTDRWDTGVGDIGLALGFASTDSTAPEEFYATSTAWVPCNTVNPTPTLIGAPATSIAGSNCRFDPASSNPTYFVTSSYSLRQISTEDKRRAFIGALQWRPNDLLDVNLDVQLSRRSSFEDRHDLTIAEGRRGIAPVVVGGNKAALIFSGNSYLESTGTARQRDEDYDGGGLAVKFTPTDRLTITSDLSYSRTHRNQVDKAVRLRSGAAFGAGGRVAYTLNQRDTKIPNITFALPIDLMNYDAFNTAAFARRQMEDREDEIMAGRVDATYELGDGFLQSVKVGARYSDHNRITDLANNNNLETIPAAQTLLGNQLCRVEPIVRDWGRDGGSNIQRWAQFDTQCLYRSFTGVDDRGPLADARGASDLNINEKIGALYAMASFRSELAAIPFTGNVGVRVVQTDVTSKGYRGDYDIVLATDDVTLVPIPGSFQEITIENDFVRVLPSFNINFSLRDDLYLRGAAYKALARSNIEAMGAGRNFVIDNNARTVEESITGVSGGNPRLETLDAWNGDLSLEWYPDRDTLFSAAFFYKDFKAAAVPDGQSNLTETFTIDGQTFTVPVSQQINSDESSYIVGFELTANKAFTFLPSPFDGLGAQLNYSYADSDFEFPDPSTNDPLNPLANFTEPAGFNGLSNHTGSATAYYEKYGLALRLVYKYRSDYFKANGAAPNRIVDSAGYLDFSASYNLTKNIQLKFQAINLNEGYSYFQRPVSGSNGETSLFGTSYFAGIRLRF